MTEFTRPATWDDVRLLARYLDEAGVDYALVGGYAVALHGLNRFSEDIDILVEPGDDNAKRWIAALARLPDRAARELEGESNVFALDKRYAVRINDEFTIDVMPSAGGLSWEELEPYIEIRELDGVRVRVLNLQGLLKTKQGLRPKDQMDAAAIRAVLDTLDKSTD